MVGYTQLPQKELLNKRIPFLDLRVTDLMERAELLKAVETVLKHGRLILGPEAEELERSLAQRTCRNYAVGVNSGTDALYLGLRALDVGSGDEVITTSLSWIATANAITLTGAEPVFADIGNDLNIDPDSIRQLVTPRTKAVIPVHYTGKICNMPEIMDIAREYKLKVIEDAAQAFGACLSDQPAGSFGDIGSFSMNAMKILAACGEAGALVTDSEDIHDRLLSLRYNGTVNKETCIEPSLNGRLDTLQAAILLKRLDRLESIIERRRRIAEMYDELLAGFVETPPRRPEEYDVYYTYTIQCDQREELARFLENRGIETKVQHSILMPDQQYFQGRAKGSWINAGRIVSRILSIPANEKITDDDVFHISGLIRSFLQGKS